MQRQNNRVYDIFWKLHEAHPGIILYHICHLIRGSSSIRHHIQSFIRFNKTLLFTNVLVFGYRYRSRSVSVRVPRHIYEFIAHCDFRFWRGITKVREYFLSVCRVLMQVLDGRLPSRCVIPFIRCHDSSPSNFPQQKVLYQANSVYSDQLSELISRDLRSIYEIIQYILPQLKW